MLDNKRPELVNARLSGIDAARGVAALLVVMFHATGTMNDPKYFGSMPIGGIFNFGYAGVDFFFVLSGFIMLFMHHDDIGRKQAFRSYALKRFLRIYPVYWLVSTLVLSALALMPSKGLPAADFLLKSFMLLPQQEIFPLVVVAWSLVHEVFFYLLFGILILHSRVGWMVMGLWFLGILITVGAEIEWSYWLAFVFHFRNLEFLLGMLVAFLYLFGPRVSYPIALVVGGVGLFCTTGTKAPTFRVLA